MKGLRNTKMYRDPSGKHASMISFIDDSLHIPISFNNDMPLMGSETGKNEIIARMLFRYFNCFCNKCLKNA